MVTDQYVDIRPDGCYCNFALLGTLKNMSVMGELYIAAAKLSPKKPAAQPVNRKLDFIDKNHVRHFKPLTSSVGEYLANNSYNREMLNDMIPCVDLVIAYTPGHNIKLAFKIANQEEIRDLAEDYLEDLLEEQSAFIASYAPEELPKLEGAEVRTFGNYTVYAIADDRDRALIFETVEKALRKK